MRAVFRRASALAKQRAGLGCQPFCNVLRAWLLQMERVRIEMKHSLAIEITARSLLKFTMPSIIMMLVMSLYTVVDGVFVANLINTDAFSAVNIAYPLLSFVIAIGTMFGTGLSAIVSQKIGEGKKQEACENMTFIVVFTMVLATVLAVVAFVTLDGLVAMLGANAETAAYCRAYLFPLLFFIPAYMLQIQFQSLFVANGKPGAGLVVTVLGGVTNIVLDYVFIKYCGWGISGAAIATGLGACIPALYGLYCFGIERKALLHFVKPHADWRVLLHTMTNGSSEMVSNLSAAVTTLLFNIIMMRFLGSQGVAAIGIVLYLDFVLIAISLGYSIGVAPLFSFNNGCGNTQKLGKLYRLSVLYCVVTGVSMALVTVLFARQLTAIFTPEGSPVFELAVTGLRICAISYVMKGFNIFSSAVFTAFSDGRVSAILSFMRTLLFLAGSLIGLSALFGVDGVWFAQPLAEFLALGLCVFYSVRYRKAYHFNLKPSKPA